MKELSVVVVGTFHHAHSVFLGFTIIPDGYG